MTGENTCNGWTNYATWRVNLELCDDYIQSQAEDINAGYQDKWADTLTLAYALQEYVEEAVTGFGEISDETLAVQYAQAFISNVNWYEIAATFKADNPDLFEDDED